MRSTGIFEAKNNFSALIESVEAGEEVSITRHGKEVARLVPVPAGASPGPRSSVADDALLALKRLRAEVEPGPGWRELRDEGRE